MTPDVYEKQLIQWQFEHRKSIFACEGHAVYSNKAVEISPGLTTHTVASDLKCEHGGEFGTALNIDIFMAVWARVVLDGGFDKFGYTVKVDPDSVFFPIRLKGILEQYQDGPEGLYVNNCKRGLHGPLEVFSRNAVHRWWDGAPQCHTHFTQLCSGMCGWGEDMYIDQCLDKVLHVRREYSPNILVEDHCDPPPNWIDCQTQQYASFHPFKTVERYKKCLFNSER